jgi:hypothetical protein
MHERSGGVGDGPKRLGILEDFRVRADATFEHLVNVVSDVKLLKTEMAEIKENGVHRGQSFVQFAITLFAVIATAAISHLFK